MHLAAQTKQEFELQWGFVGEIDGLEVQDVRLNAKAHAFEGWPVADVGYRFEALLPTVSRVTYTPKPGSRPS